MSMVRITAPSGMHVILVDYDHDEHLLPTFVEYLDRRLGLKSPWAYPGDDVDPK